MSEALGIKVDPDQIIMSQSPLEMFHEYHDKTVLVVGPEHDGGFFDVAQELGFENIVTLGKGSDSELQNYQDSPNDALDSGPDQGQTIHKTLYRLNISVLSEDNYST